ncbi:MAG TPA: hypothetical protein VEX68_23350 [Bryobacteraceae bacterium]|nr:hypothetical protein [Bryobacteraceae bacterium]
MRRLNRYARERRIRLIYGGYGAAYDLASRPGEYQGAPHLNRDSYPDGHVYSRLNYPGGKPNVGTLGTCRSNDTLNRVKGEELVRFVDAVESGAVYIHHEDCCVFEDFQKAWLGRCDRCRNTNTPDCQPVHTQQSQAHKTRLAGVSIGRFTDRCRLPI